MTDPKDIVERLEATPKQIAAAWATWHARHGGKLGPGPAFVEAINAALNADTRIHSAIECTPSDREAGIAEGMERAAVYDLYSAKVEIRKLKRQRKTLIQALEPIANLAARYDGFRPSDAAFSKGGIYVSDVRRADAAIRAAKEVKT